jgi:pimeloyl-ACP methyl ester carboxylesterase
MHTEVVEVAGLRLGLLSAGAPTNPALVLLHGWPQSKEVYDGVVDRLAADHFVLAFDLPEIGDSRGAPRSAEKKDLADVVLEAAERRGGSSPLIAGFDVGGMVAYAAAHDYAHRITGAIVMNTVIPGIDPWSKVLTDPRIWHFAFHATDRLPELLVAGRQRAYFDFFIDFLAGRKEAITERHRAAFANAYERAEALRAGFDWYRTMQADAARNREPKEILTPMLYLRGDADGGSPDDYVRALREKGAQRLSGATLHGSGECAPLESPDDFVREVTTFAKACLPSASRRASVGR